MTYDKTIKSKTVELKTKDYIKLVIPDIMTYDRTVKK